MTKSFIDLHKISASHDSQPVLRNVDIQLEQGKHLVLIGSSGSGKTTLLRTIAGLHPIDSGTISVNHRVLASNQHQLAPEERNIGFVFQDHALFPHLTAAENIAFAAKLDREQQREIEIMLEITELLNHYPHQLSGGQQQRVALARSICFDAPVLLLDEPFASLDESLRKKVIPKLCQFFQRRKTTVISVAHDQSDAFAIADEMAYLEDGRLIQQAPPEVLFNEPSTRAVAEFLSVGVWLNDDEIGQLPMINRHRPAREHSGVFVSEAALRFDERGELSATIIDRRFCLGRYNYWLMPNGTDIILRSVSTELHEVDQKVTMQLQSEDYLKFFKDDH